MKVSASSIASACTLLCLTSTKNVESFAVAPSSISAQAPTTTQLHSSFWPGSVTPSQSVATGRYSQRDEEDGVPIKAFQQPQAPPQQRQQLQYQPPQEQYMDNGSNNNNMNGSGGAPYGSSSMEQAAPQQQLQQPPQQQYLSNGNNNMMNGGTGAYGGMAEQSMQPPQQPYMSNGNNNMMGSGGSVTETYNLAVSQEFAASLRDDEFADVTFLVENEQVHAHRIILSNRCEAFKDLFEEHRKPFASVKLVIPIRTISAPVFKLLLEFLYTDQIPPSTEYVPELFCLAHRYKLPNLKETCRNVAQELMNIENAAVLLEKSTNCCPDCTDDSLRNLCINYVRANFAQVSVTPGMQCVNSNAILSVVQGRNLV